MKRKVASAVVGSLITLGLMANPAFASTNNTSSHQTEKNKVIDAIDMAKVKNALKSVHLNKIKIGEHDEQRYTFPDGSYIVVSESSTASSVLPKLTANHTLLPMLTSYSQTASSSISAHDVFGATVWTLTFWENFDFNGQSVPWVNNTPWFTMHNAWYSVWNLESQTCGASIKPNGNGYASGTAVLTYGLGNIINVQTITDHCSMNLYANGLWDSYWY